MRMLHRPSQALHTGCRMPARGPVRPPMRSLTHHLQTFIDAPNPASGQIPKDVAPYFSGPYHEWTTVERIVGTQQGHGRG